MYKCPCKDCICLPICRHKNVDRLVKKCTLLDEFIEDNSTRYIEEGIRLTSVSALKEVNKAFKWGSYAT